MGKCVEDIIIMLVVAGSDYEQMKGEAITKTRARYQTHTAYNEGCFPMTL